MDPPPFQRSQLFQKRDMGHVKYGTRSSHGSSSSSPGSIVMLPLGKYLENTLMFCFFSKNSLCFYFFYFLKTKSKERKVENYSVLSVSGVCQAARVLGLLFSPLIHLEMFKCVEYSYSCLNCSVCVSVCHCVCQDFDIHDNLKNKRSLASSF